MWGLRSLQPAPPWTYILITLPRMTSEPSICLHLSGVSQPCLTLDSMFWHPKWVPILSLETNLYLVGVPASHFSDSGAPSHDASKSHCWWEHNHHQVPHGFCHLSYETSQLQMHHQKKIIEKDQAHSNALVNINILREIFIESKELCRYLKLFL